MCKFGYFDRRKIWCMKKKDFCTYKDAFEDYCECPEWEDHLESVKLVK